MLRLIVLGAAAGGGFPQWNSNGAACRRARAGDTAAIARTQCSVAASVDDRSWVLLDAAPDLRAQFQANPALFPGDAMRSSPLRAVVLTGADIDKIAGLLTLREGHPFALFAAPPVLRTLAANPIFDVLQEGLVTRRGLQMGRAVTPVPGMQILPFPVPGKVPLYMEAGADRIDTGEEGDAIGLRIDPGDGRRIFYVPGCAAVSDGLAARLEGADLVLFDGTLWRDDEMIRMQAGHKTGRRMGHMSIDGPDGTLAIFSRLKVKRKVLIHVNNTNPVLLADSPERAQVEAAGWEVAYDGMALA